MVEENTAIELNGLNGVCTTKGITVGVVLSFLGSDVMNVRRALTVSGCIHKKSHNSSVEDTFKTSLCMKMRRTNLQIMSVFNYKHVATVPITAPIGRLSCQPEVCVCMAVS